MAHFPVKSKLEHRVATDDQIFNRLNKKLNGLDKPVSLTPTIQNQGDVIKPDGTVARDNDDIRLAQGEPLRTPRGVLEYKEDTPDENFPVKISLQSEKYDAESFYDAVSSNFDHFLSGFDIPETPIPVINVTDGPTIVQEVVDPTGAARELFPDQDNEEDIPEPEALPTAVEEYGDEWVIKTEINAAGDLTGVAGTMWVVWRNIKYRLWNNPARTTEGGNGHTDGNSITAANGAGHTESGQKNPKRINGLTNTISGRNLEVFLAERGLQYDMIEIVPKADIKSHPTISEVLKSLDQEIEWDSPENDGWQYNKKDVVINEITYQKGDIIKPSDQVESKWKVKVFLPNISSRWTEYHPQRTNKPARPSQIYTPTGNEILSKQWEGRLLKAWNGGVSQGFFICMGGTMYHYKGSMDEYALIKVKHDGKNIMIQRIQQWIGIQ